MIGARRELLLWEEASATESARIRGYVSETGDVEIAGQDIGASVEAFWGPGRDEYEWTITVGRSGLDGLEKTLPGPAGGDVLKRLSAFLVATGGVGLRAALERNGVPFEFWSRSGG